VISEVGRRRFQTIPGSGSRCAKYLVIPELGRRQFHVEEEGDNFSFRKTIFVK